MKLGILLLWSVLSAVEVNAQDLDAEKQKVVQHFIDLVKRGDKEKIATTFGREYPIPPVTKSDFIKRYNEIFDDSLKHMIIHSDPAKDWAEMGWRGIMLGNGVVWLDDDGSLEAVNYQSAWEEKERKRLIKEDRDRLHPSLQTYVEPILIMETSTYRIRIDDLGGQNYRYASWKKEHSIGEEPDIIIIKGQVEYDGSGGNHHYTFQNNDYTYTCDIIVMGEDNSPPAMLTISKGDKDVLTQKAVSLKGE